MGEVLPRLPGQGLVDGEVELGLLMGAFGVRGEVRVWLHHPETEAFDRPRDVVLVAPDGSRHRARLGLRPGAGKRILGRIDGLTDPEAAATLKDWKVVAPLASLGRLDEGEFWVVELEGATVRVEGEDVGEVTAVQHTAGPDVLVVRLAKDVALVPMTKDFVLGFDRVARVVLLAPDALEEG